MTETIKIAIYLLCVLTAGGCCFLLFRGWRRSGTRLLMWSAICFGFLALHGIAVMADLLIFPSIDLRFFRHAATLAAVAALLVGLVWETE